MAVNKVVFGTETLIDLTSDTVAPEVLLAGYTATNAAGEAIAGAAVIPTKTSELENDSGFLTEQDISGKLDKTGDGSNVTAAFSVASSRTNILTGEKLSVLFGKIAKWFSDLGSLAFKSTVAKSDLESSVTSELDTAYTHSQSAHAPSNAQENVIESIKVNGAEQTVTDKAVNITVPEPDLSGYVEKNNGVAQNLYIEDNIKLGSSSDTTYIMGVPSSLQGFYKRNEKFRLGTLSNGAYLSFFPEGSVNNLATPTIDKAAANKKYVDDTVSAHSGNSTIHVTADEKSAWNAKADATELAKKQNKVTYGTTDLTAGSSVLATGELYFVYE